MQHQHQRISLLVVIVVNSLQQSSVLIATKWFIQTTERNISVRLVRKHFLQKETWEGTFKVYTQLFNFKLILNVLSI